MTDIERLILANQFRILGVISNDNGYKKHLEIVERGFTGQYYQLFSGISREVGEDVCEEVGDILDMHRCLLDTFNGLADKSVIDDDLIQFKGFDANNESNYYGYLRFMVQELGYWPMFKDVGDGLNSHCGTLDGNN